MVQGDGQESRGAEPQSRRQHESVWHRGREWAPGHRESLEVLQGLTTGRVAPGPHPGRQLCSQKAACTSLAGRLGAEGGQGCAKKVAGLAGLWGKKPGQHPGPHSSCILRTYKVGTHGSPGHSPAPTALGQELLLCGRRPGCGCSPPSPCASGSLFSPLHPGPEPHMETASHSHSGPVAQHHFLRFPRTVLWCSLFSGPSRL